MEFYQYQEGLIRRYMDQQGAWDQHLEKCRDYILRAIGQISPDKVTILGSGWLLEVPLLEISEKAKNVCLIDIIHPADVTKQVSVLNNVKLIEADITGGLIENISTLAGRPGFIRKKIDMDKISMPEFIFDEDPGMVISVNLLSQLDSLPVRMLRKRTRATDDELSGFRRRIQEQHLDMLKKHRSVLISDFVEIFTSVTGVINEERTVIADMPEGKMAEGWTWDFDTGGTDFNRKSSVLKVKAMIL